MTKKVKNALVEEKESKRDTDAERKSMSIEN